MQIFTAVPPGELHCCFRAIARRCYDGCYDAAAAGSIGRRGIARLRPPRKLAMQRQRSDQLLMVSDEGALADFAGGCGDNAGVAFAADAGGGVGAGVRLGFESGPGSAATGARASTAAAGFASTGFDSTGLAPAAGLRDASSGGR
ncbi:MAG: hypothetical protein WAM75_21630, partial [Xanthobacteraceae bacterium]